MFAKVKPNTQIIGQNIIYFNRVDSTNSIAFELMKQNMADDGTVIIAEHQGNGRGQGTKQWISDAYENLLFSVILKPVTNTYSDPFIINKAIALALQTSIQEVLPNEKVNIKWPNDILVNKRKICGILVENNYSGQNLNWSIAGIGLNVNQDFEAISSLNASSLKNISGYEFQREVILKNILESIESCYLNVLNSQNDTISQSFNQMLLGFNSNQKFILDQKEVNGEIVGCDRDGRLMIQFEDSKVQSFLHGTIKQIVYE